MVLTAATEAGHASRPSFATQQSSTIAPALTKQLVLQALRVRRDIEPEWAQSGPPPAGARTPAGQEFRQDVKRPRLRRRHQPVLSAWIAKQTLRTRRHHRDN